MDRFDAMQAFARVVETGSFTKAAATLHMSRTTVTQLVQQLEARLRVRLLNRTTRQVNVTADGAAYYERVVRLLADVDDAETSLSSASRAPRGRLRVDVPSPFARMILVPALPAFHTRHPEIQLDLGVSDRRIDLIGENVDCVVRGGTIPTRRWSRATWAICGWACTLHCRICSAWARPRIRASWKTRTTASSAFCGHAPASRCRSRCSAATKRYVRRGVTWWRWTMAMPTSPQVSPDWA